MSQKQRVKKFVGGQAVIEGVMMCGPSYTATAVRNPEGDIVVEKKTTNPLSKRYPILRKPLLRGCVALFESLSMGMKALMFSAKVQGTEEEPMTNKDLTIAMTVAVVFAMVLFVAIPTYAVKFIPHIQENHVLLNVVEGILRLVIFLLYIGSMGFMPDMKRTFQYHGAEHKTIHTYESDEELTVENVKKHSRLHPRCGTNFLLIVMVVSIVVFAFLGWPSLIERIVSRIILMPVVAGISYEVIRWAGRSQSCWTHRLIAPGLWLQYLTTREPSSDQIEVAIRALQEVRPPESEAYEEA